MIDFGKCCGGNDEDPQEHTQDCGYSINRYVEIETAARKYIERPCKTRLQRLARALRPLPTCPRPETAIAEEKKR